LIIISIARAVNNAVFCHLSPFPVHKHCIQTTNICLICHSKTDCVSW